VVYEAALSNIFAVSFCGPNGLRNSIAKTEVVTATTAIPGSNLLTRRWRNALHENVLVLATSRIVEDKMTNPEMTKNMSTPRYPPLSLVSK
jgi:hypothetical protein